MAHRPWILGNEALVNGILQRISPQEYDVVKEWLQCGSIKKWPQGFIIIVFSDNKDAFNGVTYTKRWYDANGDEQSKQATEHRIHCDVWQLHNFETWTIIQWHRLHPNKVQSAASALDKANIAEKMMRGQFKDKEVWSQRHETWVKAGTGGPEEQMIAYINFFKQKAKQLGCQRITFLPGVVPNLHLPGTATANLGTHTTIDNATEHLFPEPETTGPYAPGLFPEPETAGPSAGYDVPVPRIVDPIWTPEDPAVQYVEIGSMPFNAAVGQPPLWK